MFKTTTLVSNFLHRHSHPDRQYLTILSFYSNIIKHFGHRFALMLPRFEMIFLIMYTIQHLLLPSGNSSKLTCSQKIIHHGYPCVFFGVAWLCYWQCMGVFPSKCLGQGGVRGFIPSKQIESVTFVSLTLM